MDNTKEVHGTKFVVFNPDDQLIVLSKEETKELYPEYEDTIIEIRKSLNGLFNVFKEDNVSISTKFAIISSKGERDLISTRQFFTHNDFELADHLINGHFDETGVFTGKIRIYKETFSHTFRPIRKPGKTLYGEFNIKLGVLPGRVVESLLNEEQYNELDQRVWDFGGLYVYRDGFRVLPYGRPEADFLEFEQRRSKHAGYYFFSHRQMFGYIEITRKNNKRLMDKAGREGFINNAAYREFKSDLMSFFIDLSRKYFGTGAESDLKEKLRNEVKEASQNELAEKKVEKQQRKQYARNLKEYPLLLEEVGVEYEQLLKELAEKQNQPELIFEDIDQILKKIEACKNKAKRLDLKKPIRFSLSERQEKSLFDYKKKYDTFISAQISSAQKEIDKARNKLKDYDLVKEFDAKYKQYRSFIISMFEEAGDKTNQSVTRIKERLEEEKDTLFLAELAKQYEAIRPTSYNRNEILESLSHLETVYKDIVEKAHSRIDPFIDHIERLNLEVDEEALTGYYKLRYEEIEKQWSQTKELAQMGIAVEIIDHQFNVLYSQVATAITQIKQDLPDSKKALRNYNSLKTAFEHLEDKYRLMSPLYRTTGKVRKEITGKEIKEYLKLFFGAQLDDREIVLDSSKEFDKSSFFTYESVLLPAFVNVIHNAIYWLTSVEERRIYLDIKEESKILILNSGEPIEDFYLNEIFKLFYSKKPNGRGIGLFLARETLLSIGYDMYATNDPNLNTLKGACFVIDSNPIENK